MKRPFTLKITLIALICSLCLYATAQSASGNNKTHVIQKGETLYRIALQYHITEKLLCEMNPGLSADNFKIGSTLVVPNFDERSQSGIAGSNCQFMHKAKKKETLFSIASKYGISVDELKAANPETQKMEYQLKKGDVLCIPFPTTTVNVVNDEIANNNAAAQAKESHTEELAVVNVALVLPLKGNSAQNAQMVEFYRGFLMAVNYMKEQGLSFRISTYDAPVTSNIQSILDSEGLAQADIIFGPADSTQVAKLGTFAQNKEKVMVSPFYRWSLQMDVNPKFFALNPTPRIQSADALKIFQSIFANANIIALETSEQTDVFAQLVKDNVSVAKLSFPTTEKEIQDKLKKGTMNVIMPCSSDLKTLNILLPIVSQLRTANPELDICLFGYPIWQSYVDSRINDFHAANTYFFTPFYLNRSADTFKSFSNGYMDAYKQPLTTAWPPMAVYGYDCAMHFLGGMAAFGHGFTTQNIYAKPIAYPFVMKRVSENGGLANRNMQVVHYKPTHTIDNITLDN